ncbi:S46 family peptidase, partial [Dyella silvatica]|uniref:S46 family peptidase n=1 Tax=Dyella silvatica TaxID=2992128 RepID=UPI0022531B2D
MRLKTPTFWTAWSAAVAMACASTAQADEGMWMPAQLPAIGKPLRAMGYLGNPVDLADLTKPPLSAVVKVGGATGAFVSDEGLVLTNHHVAFGVIQYNSNVQRDLIENGYVAADRSQELPANPDFRLRVTTGFDKVTEQVLADTQGKTGRAFYDAVDVASKHLVAACEREPGMRCSVVNMFYGSDYYLVKQLELRDVRLVYAPPRAIGNYGDEVDNFVWPRHSGDFTVLRAYVGPDGKPASYAKENQPYRPPAHLQVASEGVKEGDFVMLAGYPGVTYRHRSAAEFADQIEWRLPTTVTVLKQLQGVIETAGENHHDASIHYAAQLQSLKNSIKRFSGELEGLQRSDAVSTRSEDETAMLAWLSRQPDSAHEQADIAQAGKLIAAGKDLRDRDLLLGLIHTQSQLMRAAWTIERLDIERAKPDADRETGYQQRDEELLASQLRQVSRRYDPAVEKTLLTALLTRYQQLPAAQHMAEFDEVFGRTPAELARALDNLYAATRLADEAERLRLFKASAETLHASDDALLVAARKLQPALLRMEDQRKEREGDLLRLRPAYMKALIAYRQAHDRAVYPDANSTLRVSYGKVTPLLVRDAVTYGPLTSVGGIVEKNTGKPPFDAPKPLLAAIRKGDFGRYLDPATKSMPVNFLSNLDTTGGNSGSPVLNA